MSIFNKDLHKNQILALFCIFLFFLPVSSLYGQSSEIRILHVNDFHGFADPSKPVGSDEILGGIAYLSDRVNELRKEKPSLLLSAGDMIQGYNWANLFLGGSVIELMNEMRFDVMVLGNHEFDFGQEVLRKRISEANFPVLGANVEGPERVNPYFIKEVNGVKIAILGVVTEDVPVSTHPKNVLGLKFFSVLETVEKYLNLLKSRADLVVLLSHIGYPVDRMLAEKVKGIDVIVGGHSHTRIPKPVKIGDSIIVQAWEYGKALGILDLTLKDGKIIKHEGYLEEIKPGAGRKGPAVQTLVDRYNQRMDAVLNIRIGETQVDLNGERSLVRTKETNLGNLIADIMKAISGAEVAVINGGGIRSSIKKGEIKVKDVYNVLPFDNYNVAIKLTGKQIWETLEHGVSAVEEEEGRFPQVSGLTFKYSPSEPKGSRVKEVFVADQPVSLNRDYTVATNDFLAAGGDDFKTFGEAVKSSRDFAVIGGMMKGEKVVYSDSGRWLRDVMVEYIKGKEKIAPTVEGRIKEVQ
jgi:2',3'-cyclic-nucleotide 2'-phosphodiesterase (5'-nucleotidase family)